MMGRESGLRPTSAATVLYLAAQSVLSFIGSRVRNEGMTATSLATFLQSEGSGMRVGSAGFHEEHPVGDNATEAGRAQNRRISMLVTQK